MATETKEMLCQHPLTRQVAAVAVEKGRAQLQRVTYDTRGKSTIEELSCWTPVSMFKPSLGILMFHVRAANAYAKVGDHASANDALKAAHGMFA